MAEESFKDRFRRLITCSICSEYTVKPTKLIECFHTFCFVCIEKHLEKQRTCPECVPKVYDRDIDRPSLHRSMVVDTALEEIINALLPEEAALCNFDDWCTKHDFTPPVRRIAHLTSEDRSQRCPKPDDWLSIYLNCPENIKLEDPCVLVLSNSTIRDLKKAIAKKLFSDEFMHKKIILSAKGRKLEDNLTMLVIFIHLFEYQEVPMPFELNIETREKLLC